METLLETVVPHSYEDDFELWEVELSQNTGELHTNYPVETMIAEERAALFIGRVAMNGLSCPETSSPSSGIESLHDAIKVAAQGNQQARKVIETNVRTDVIERTLKSGHVCSPVPLTFTEDGRLVQFSQTLESVMANTLKYVSDNSIMRERAEAEVSNNFLIEELYRSGFFEANNLVVFSPAEDLPEYGFFTETMSCNIQVISATETGLELTTAFVSGVNMPGGKRHDLGAIGLIGDRFGKELRGKTPAQIIGAPIMVDKSLMPNGAASAVEWYDDALGGTFFGEIAVRRNYKYYTEECRQREVKYESLSQTITDELIARSGQINSPQQACRLLNKLSGEKTIELAISDNQIDSRVFGAESADYIEQARHLHSVGDYLGVELLTEKAKEHDQSSSCPSAMGVKQDSSFGTDSNKSDETCEFVSKKCPKCGTKNVKTTVTSREIKGACGCKSKINK